MMNAVVLTQNMAGGIDNLPLRPFRLEPLLYEVGVDKSGVVAIRNEADLLAVRLCGNGDAEGSREFPDFRLGKPSQRK